MKAIVFASQFDYTKAIIGRTDHLQEIEVVYPGVYSNNRFANRLIKKLIRESGTHKILEPVADHFRHYWNRLRKYGRGMPVCMILFDSFKLSKDESFLRSLRRRFRNSKLVLLLFNPISQEEAEQISEKKMYDHVYSFDFENCEKYDYKHFMMYSGEQMNPCEPCMQDLFFIGKSKGRESELGKIHKLALENGMIPYIHIIVEEKGVRVDSDGLKIDNKRERYSAVLEHIRNSRCILDIVQEGQRGFDLRVFEAVAYNKLLITNNPRIRSMPFYDSRYMQYIQSADEINWQMIQSTREVDYHYDGRFSADKVLMEIMKAVAG